MTEILEGVEQKSETSVSKPVAEPLFVIGMFRSGTSLLYALLNQHPEITLMYEGDLPILYPLFWFRPRTFNWLSRWEFWNGAPTKHKIDLSGIPEDIVDLPTAFREVYVRFSQQKKGASIWGCKSPTYFDHLTRLADLFPNAKFIIIWRDPRSIAKSVRKAAEKPSFFRRAGMMHRCMLGYREMKKQYDDLVQRGASVHELSYEDLVREPGPIMQEVCRFLQIPFDPKMTSLEGADRSAIENAPHHNLVKAEKIVAKKKNFDDIPPELKSKIDRYLALWRRESNGAWPPYPQTLDTNEEPSWAERLKDRIKYRALNVWYHSSAVVFAFVPLPLWKLYRRLMGRPYALELNYQIKHNEAEARKAH